MKNVMGTFAVAALYVFLSLSSAEANEAYFTYPGTRAMSMGGAFVAQADDSSAIWYNPGGIAQKGSPELDFSVEYGSVPSRSDTGQYSSDKKGIKFVSVGWKGDKDKETTFGMGLAYFTPYRFAINVPSVGRVDTKYSEVAWTLGGRSSGFSYGGNIDVLWSDKKLGSSDGSSDTQMGYGYSLGALYNVFNNEYVGVTVGGMYRSKIKMSSEDPTTTYTPEGAIIVKYLPSRPASMSGGVNVTVPTPYATVRGNVAYEKTKWAEAYPLAANPAGMDTTKIMYGGEVVIPISRTDLALRAGHSESKASDSAKFATVKSFTYGAGLKLSKAEGSKSGEWFLDFAQEQRSFSGSSTKYNFWSTSVSYQF